MRRTLRTLMHRSSHLADRVGAHLRAFLRDVADPLSGRIGVIPTPTAEQRRQTKIAVCGYGLGIAVLAVTGSLAWAFAVTAVGVGGGVLLFGDL